MSHHRLPLFVFLATTIACQEQDGKQDATEPSGADTAGDTGGFVVECPDDMLQVRGRAVCIDRHEYTNQDFLAFIKSNGDYCDGHDCMGSGGQYHHLNDYGCHWDIDSGYNEHPMLEVTWYGAKVACEADGKVLCPATVWQAACSDGGDRGYPYADSFDATSCNGADLGEDDTVSVTSLPGCEGGLSELYDMSGNVWEWTSTCSGDDCESMGGAFDSSDSAMACEASQSLPADQGTHNVGFRCCLTF